MHQETHFDSNGRYILSVAELLKILKKFDPDSTYLLCRSEDAPLMPSPEDPNDVLSKITSIETAPNGAQHILIFHYKKIKCQN